MCFFFSYLTYAYFQLLAYSFICSTGHDAKLFLYTFCLMMQMLTSKDTNFIGFTFKKSDVLESLESSGSHFEAWQFYYGV